MTKHSPRYYRIRSVVRFTFLFLLAFGFFYLTGIPTVL